MEIAQMESLNEEIKRINLKLDIILSQLGFDADEQGERTVVSRISESTTNKVLRALLHVLNNSDKIAYHEGFPVDAEGRQRVPPTGPEASQG